MESVLTQGVAAALEIFGWKTVCLHHVHRLASPALVGGGRTFAMARLVPVFDLAQRTTNRAVGVDLTSLILTLRDTAVHAEI